jgi:hypothetical protein
MSKTISIVAQVLGYQFLIAMITTIRLKDVLVFDPPFVVRAVFGVFGMLMVFAGSFYYRMHLRNEKKGNGEPDGPANGSQPIRSE